MGLITRSSSLSTNEEAGGGGTAEEEELPLLRDCSSWVGEVEGGGGVWMVMGEGPVAVTAAAATDEYVLEDVVHDIGRELELTTDLYESEVFVRLAVETCLIGSFTTRLFREEDLRVSGAVVAE